MVVPRKHRAGRVPSELHRHAFGHAAANEAENGGAADILGIGTLACAARGNVVLLGGHAFLRLSLLAGRFQPGSQSHLNSFQSGKQACEQFSTPDPF
jgi:hypothetical protein